MPARSRGKGKRDAAAVAAFFIPPVGRAKKEKTIAKVLELDKVRILYRSYPAGKAVHVGRNALSVDARIEPYVDFFNCRVLHFESKDWPGQLLYISVLEWRLRRELGNYGEGNQWYTPLERFRRGKSFYQAGWTSNRIDLTELPPYRVVVPEEGEALSGPAQAELELEGTWPVVNEETAGRRPDGKRKN